MSYASLLGAGLRLVLKNGRDVGLLALSESDFDTRYLVFDEKEEGLNKLRWVRKKEAKDIKGL